MERAARLMGDGCRLLGAVLGPQLLLIKLNHLLLFRHSEAYWPPTLATPGARDVGECS